MGRIEIVEQRLELASVVEDEQTPSGKRRLVFEAVVSEADHVNQNGRVYPLEVLWPAFEQVNEDLGAYPGAVDHPVGGGASFSDNGIRWQNFWLEDRTIKGRGEIIWTKRGQDLAANIEAGVKVGFSTRTFASVEEVEIDGRPVRRIREMDPPFVDAVVTPSVKHARIASYQREEQEQMELQEALARIAELEGQLSGATAERDAAAEALTLAESRSTELEGQLAEAQTELTSAQESNKANVERIAELETALATEQAEKQLETRLAELTEGHRFAATLVVKAREMGVTLENVERVVTTLKELTEGIATSSADNQGQPRGEISNEEDAAPAAQKQGEKGRRPLTAEEREQLRGSGLVPDR